MFYVIIIYSYFQQTLVSVYNVPDTRQRNEDTKMCLHRCIFSIASEISDKQGRNTRTAQFKLHVGKACEGPYPGHKSQVSLLINQLWFFSHNAFTILRQCFQSVGQNLVQVVAVKLISFMTQNKPPDFFGLNCFLLCKMGVEPLILKFSGITHENLFCASLSNSYVIDLILLV